MSWVSGACDPLEPLPKTVVVIPKDGPNGEPGKLIWQDTGSGPGHEFWVPDDEWPDEEWPPHGFDKPSISGE